MLWSKKGKVVKKGADKSCFPAFRTPSQPNLPIFPYPPVFPPQWSPVRLLLARREIIPTNAPSIEDLGKEAADQGPKAQESASTPRKRQDCDTLPACLSLFPTLLNPTHARMSADSRSKASRWTDGSSSNLKGPSPSKLFKKRKK